MWKELRVNIRRSLRIGGSVHPADGIEAIFADCAPRMGCRSLWRQLADSPEVRNPQSHSDHDPDPASMVWISKASTCLSCAHIRAKGSQFFTNTSKGCVYFSRGRGYSLENKLPKFRVDWGRDQRLPLICNFEKGGRKCGEASYAGLGPP